MVQFQNNVKTVLFSGALNGSLSLHRRCCGRADRDDVGAAVGRGDEFGRLVVFG